jgi:hypothetical protein
VAQECLRLLADGRVLVINLILYHVIGGGPI